MAFPVRTVVVPSILQGQSNGKLDPAILSDTPGLAGGPTVRLIGPASRAWRALAAAAQSGGHTLKISGAYSAYRPYAEQERIFLERYRRDYKANTDVKVWNGVRWYRWFGATAAVPGTSNHGRGLAVDTGEERDGDPGAESLDGGTLDWLLDHAERFGFSWELQSEPWHLRYYAGDHLPQAVLDFERTVAPPPAPPDDEEDDMARIVWFKDRDGGPHAYRVAGIHGKHLTNESLQRSRAEGDEEPQGTALGAERVPLSTDEQGRYVLADGPCRNVG